MDSIRVFIGYDPRENVAINVLANSIQARSTRPVSISQIRLSQLGSVYQRQRSLLQSTDFSFSRFLVPWLCNYQGWAVFFDADMLCLSDISELWDLRDDRYAVQLVKHHHQCSPGLKFQGERQTPYARKNWSSVMLFNCSRCRSITPELINVAPGLFLHQFAWLDDGDIGSLPPEWNVLVGVQSVPDGARLLHYTLGGPWFDDCIDMDFSDLWLEEHEALNHPLPAALAACERNDNMHA
jgi:lipopolysaccharide biosynthesis glycosyltransferase